MEYGIKINDIKNLNAENLKKFKYIYFGSEFCERKLPSLDYCKKIISFSNNNNKIPVFLTPPMTDKYIEKANNLINNLVKENPKLQITLNDFGLLNKLKNLNINLNLGRLMIKMKKGPEIISANSIEKFKNNNLKNPLFRKYCKSNNLIRFEIDQPLQGLNLPDNENITLYLGNVLLSMTRYCLYPGINDENYFFRIKPCKKECMKLKLTKSTFYYKEKTHIIGNAEFLKTPFTIDSEIKPKINRIVVFPDLNSLL
ncbi:MAG: hypothetical protein ACQER9_03030 [Nanobdellota archaeon]